MPFVLENDPHRRLNILTGEWVLVSPHRNKRPWQGKVEKPNDTKRLSYDETCFLCPSNKRMDGTENPDYKGPYTFTNDFSSLLTDTADGCYNVDDLLQAESQKGICKVICFSPRHELTLPQMSVESIAEVVKLWHEIFTELEQKSYIKYIQVFENKGEIMGCSNPHPHGQVWSLNSVPAELVKETNNQKAYFNTHNKSLLTAYLELEEKQNERIVCANEHFVALVPFWATWPFETMIVSRRQVQNITQFTTEENLALADILKRLLTRYDNLFQTSFPYSGGMHQAPVNDVNHPEWHWHMHFYPPLLRNASVKKFMVGYEMLANPQRDITAESAAKRLQDLSEIHYLES